jgi:hypothetical protein
VIRRRAWHRDNGAELAWLRGDQDCAAARAWATVTRLLDEKIPVKTSSTLLMRLIKGHARWRWRT